jgi:hypothetical protein
MAIEFQCPKCRGTLRLKEKFAGQRGSCKHCGGEIRVPTVASRGEPELSLLDDDAAPMPAPSPRPTVRPVAVSNGAGSRSSAPGPNSQPKAQPQLRAAAPVNAGANLIRFRCDGCGALMQSPASDAGRAVACPRCMQRLRVPGVPAGTRPVMDGLEVLPDPDGLELLPETNSVVGSRNYAAPAASGPRYPARTSRPMFLAPKKRNVRQHFWQDPVKLVAAIAPPIMGIILWQGFRYYLSHSAQDKNKVATTVAAPMDPAPTPYLNPGPPQPVAANNGAAPTPAVNSGSVPPAVDKPAPTPTSIVAEAQNVVHVLEQNLQISQQITDVPSAQRLATNWAMNFVDAFDGMERLNQRKGQPVSPEEQAALDDLRRRAKDCTRQIQMQISRMTVNPTIKPIVNDAIGQAVAARPNSAFAQSLKTRGRVGSSTAGVWQPSTPSMQNPGVANNESPLNDIRNRVNARNKTSSGHHKPIRPTPRAQPTPMLP